MSYAVLFSGQGTQHPGMLNWLESEPAAGSALLALEGAVGPHWRTALDDPQARSANAFAQPLIVATGLAAWSALAVRLQIRPAVVAGYSVGELSAFASAGVFSEEVAIALACRRAAVMDAAVAALDTGLLSVSGLSAEVVLKACAGLDLAIDLGAEQGIYAGLADVLDTRAASLTRQGALCKRLDVRVASHSRWMAAAETAFADHLRAVPFAQPTSPVALNATAATCRRPDGLRAALSRQMATTVQWAGCLDAIAEQGVSCVLEIGAGTTLSRMWNQRHTGIPARSIEEFKDPAGAARWVTQQGGFR